MTRALALLVVMSCSAERDREPACSDCSGVHPEGILDKTSADFHGAELARRDWDVAVCATCHGADFRGGTSGVDCTNCHVEGPTACVTCHADEAATGAHAAHRRAEVACAECHVVPDRWDAPGHIVGDDPPAEVVFGARASLTPVAADREGPPSFAEGTCRNVYCHGDALHAPGGAATEPRWTDAPSTCGSCHGAPPPSHAQAACATCHPSAAPHIDGATQIGTMPGCGGCHGDPPTSGAHRAHLEAPWGFSEPVPCAACHRVPSTIADAGHIDTPVPVEVTTALGWDGGTCTNAWCHGDARPRWSETGGAVCGTCHAIPPATTVHATATTLESCATCHPADFVDHVNGVVDVR